MTEVPGPAASDAAGPVYMSTLRRRPDFLRAARAARQSRPGFTLQARERRPDEPATGARVGYTCSKKVGNAVARNRAKRRLRAIAREVFPKRGRDGWDYVLIGRPEVTATRDFALMLEDLACAVDAVHARRAR
jgi:ribonuclease P protein component